MTDASMVGSIGSGAVNDSNAYFDFPLTTEPTVGNYIVLICRLTNASATLDSVDSVSGAVSWRIGASDSGTQFTHAAAVGKVVSSLSGVSTIRASLTVPGTIIKGYAAFEVAGLADDIDKWGGIVSWPNGIPLETADYHLGFETARHIGASPNRHSGPLVLRAGDMAVMFYGTDGNETGLTATSPWTKLPIAGTQGYYTDVNVTLGGIYLIASDETRVDPEATGAANKFYGGQLFVLRRERAAEPNIVRAGPSAANSSRCASAASAWGAGAWATVLGGYPQDIAIYGFEYAPSESSSLDTTREALFELATGATGSESVKVQIPVAQRADTQVGFYLKPSIYLLPEPFEVAADTRVAVRVADWSTSALTYDGVKILYREIGGAGAYTLDAQPGAYAVTGTAATVPAGRVVTASPASFTVTGGTASPLLGRAVLADPGSYTVTAQDAAAIAARLITAEPGAHGVTGAEATVARGLFLDVDPASFTVDGNAATLVPARLLSADPASVTVTGAAAALLADRLVASDPGTVTVTGTAALLARGVTLEASPATYTLTGADAAIIAARILAVDAAAYLVTGEQAAVAYDRLFAVDPGSFTVAGAAADLVYVVVGAYILDATAGAYNVAGVDADPIMSRLLTAAPGGFSVAGADAAPLLGRAVAAEPATVIVTGAAAAALLGRTLGADAGAYTVSGEDAAALYGRTLSVEPAVYVIASPDGSLVYARIFAVDPAEFAVDGDAATLGYGRAVAADPAIYIVAGDAINAIAERELGLAPAAYLIDGASAEFAIVAGAPIGGAPITGRIVFPEADPVGRPRRGRIVFPDKA